MMMKFAAFALSCLFFLTVCDKPSSLRKLGSLGGAASTHNSRSKSVVVDSGSISDSNGRSLHERNSNGLSLQGNDHAAEKTTDGVDWLGTKVSMPFSIHSTTSDASNAISSESRNHQSEHARASQEDKGVQNIDSSVFGTTGARMLQGPSTKSKKAASGGIKTRRLQEGSPKSKKAVSGGSKFRTLQGGSPKSKEAVSGRSKFRALQEGSPKSKEAVSGSSKFRTLQEDSRKSKEALSRSSKAPKSYKSASNRILQGASPKATTTSVTHSQQVDSAYDSLISSNLFKSAEVRMLLHGVSPKSKTSFPSNKSLSNKGFQQAINNTPRPGLRGLSVQRLLPVYQYSMPSASSHKNSEFRHTLTRRQRLAGHSNNHNENVPKLTKTTESSSKGVGEVSHGGKSKHIATKKEDCTTTKRSHKGRSKTKLSKRSTKSTKGKGGSHNSSKGKGGSHNSSKGKGGSHNSSKGKGGSHNSSKGKGGSHNSSKGKGGSHKSSKGKGGSHKSSKGMSKGKAGGSTKSSKGCVGRSGKCKSSKGMSKTSPKGKTGGPTKSTKGCLGTSGKCQSSKGSHKSPTGMSKTSSKGKAGGSTKHSNGCIGGSGKCKSSKGKGGNHSSKGKMMSTKGMMSMSPKSPTCPPAIRPTKRPIGRCERQCMSWVYQNCVVLNETGDVTEDHCIIPFPFDDLFGRSLAANASTSAQDKLNYHRRMVHVYKKVLSLID